MSTLFSDYLQALGVPHTAGYSDEQFRGMTFKSIFGLSKLMQSYGIPSEALAFDDKNAGLRELPEPFMAQLKGSWGIVLKKDDSTVVLSSPENPQGKKIPVSEFISLWTGTAFVAYPQPSSAEPGLSEHRFTHTGREVLSCVFIAAVAFIIASMGFYGGIFSSVAATVLLAINCFGAWVSWLLVQKSAGYHTAAADKVCSVIEPTGCNTVLRTSASKFFGLFSWSAVGLGYFSVNIIALLLAPESIPTLSLLNICCLPFSFWSVWYQKNRAGAWCTMCLLVQASLWAIFITNLCGHFIFWPPLWTHILIVLAAYAAATLGINRLIEAFAAAMDTKKQKSSL